MIHCFTPDKTSLLVHTLHWLEWHIKTHCPWREQHSTKFYLQYGTTVPTKLNAAEMEIRDGSDDIHPHNHAHTRILGGAFFRRVHTIQYTQPNTEYALSLAIHIRLLFLRVFEIYESKRPAMRMVFGVARDDGMDAWTKAIPASFGVALGWPKKTLLQPAVWKWNATENETINATVRYSLPLASSLTLHRSPHTHFLSSVSIRAPPLSGSPSTQPPQTKCALSLCLFVRTT